MRARAPPKHSALGSCLLTEIGKQYLYLARARRIVRKREPPPKLSVEHAAVSKSRMAPRDAYFSCEFTVSFMPAMSVSSDVHDNLCQRCQKSGVGFFSEAPARRPCAHNHSLRLETRRSGTVTNRRQLRFPNQDVVSKQAETDHSTWDCLFRRRTSTATLLDPRTRAHIH